MVAVTVLATMKSIRKCHEQYNQLALAAHHDEMLRLEVSDDTRCTRSAALVPGSQTCLDWVRSKGPRMTSGGRLDGVASKRELP